MPACRVLRSQIPVGVIAVVAVVLPMTACASGSQPGARNDAAARTACTTVGRALGGPPEGKAARLRQVERLKDTGFPALDSAVHKLVQGLVASDTDQVNQAIPEVQRACVALGMWQSYH